MPKLSAAIVFGLMAVGLVSVSCTVSNPTPVPASLGPAIDLPLKLGDTWTYLVGSYVGRNPNEIMSTTRIITETVVEVKTVSTVLVAAIRQDASAEFPIYVPQSMQDIALDPATVSVYWLIVDDNRVYRQEVNLDASNLPNQAALEFVFPLGISAQWFESNETAQFNPIDSLVQVMKTDSVVLPAGRFENCYFLAETVGNSKQEDWYCPGIGYADRKSWHAGGTPFGRRQILIRYHLEK